MPSKSDTRVTNQKTMLCRTDCENSVKGVEEEENELPGWMWDKETCSLPVRHLAFTDERVVVRVYALAR